jgi:hypothetical protein
LVARFKVALGQKKRGRDRLQRDSSKDKTNIHTYTVNEAVIVGRDGRFGKDSMFIV